MERKTVERFLEFLVIGVVMGLLEDLLALKLATGAEIDLRVIGIVLMVAVPFAAFSELVVDREEFKAWRKFSSFISREE